VDLSKAPFLVGYGMHVLDEYTPVSYLHYLTGKGQVQ
jgi:hypothetical protein